MQTPRVRGFHFFFCVVQNWHGWQRLSVVIHTAVAWQTVNELERAGRVALCTGTELGALPFSINERSRLLRGLRWRACVC